MVRVKNNDFELSREDQLLLCCARTKIDDNIRVRIMSLTNHNLNWDHIIQMATIHRLLPLLYININSICPEKVPKDLLSKLKLNLQENARKNLLLTGELIKLIKLFRDNKITAVTYKGPLLASTVYGNIAYRNFGDIDILTDKKSALKAKKIMVENGYELYNPAKLSDNNYMKLESEYVFFKNGINVEINWSYQGNFFYLHNNSDLLLDEFIIENIDGFKFNSLTTVNQLLMLCIHISKHNWSRLSWLCDISELIQKEEINWDDTFKKAEKLRIKKILLINLYLSYQLLGLNLPNKIKNLINSNTSVKDISIQIKNKIFLEENISWNLLEKLVLDVKKRDNLLYGLMDSFNGLTRPTTKDVLDIKLPEKLFFFYNYLRPFLLVKRYGTGQI
ncbi:MAG: nucleotidyltransferase family protein [Methanobacteriaceae archaeon]|nr:nucleotidyltransferase family protein [Methanobacteriaceae archaeon]